MRLEVLNFAKIKNADIRLDGITVIAGENNTGKSTVGKILYSIFNSLYDIENVIEKSRKDVIISKCRRSLKSILTQREREDNWKSNTNSSRKIENAVRNFIDRLTRQDVYLDDISYIAEILHETIEKYELQVEQRLIYEFLDGVESIIKHVYNTDNYMIGMGIVEDFFNLVFGSQINNLASDEMAGLKLTLQGKVFEFDFKKNNCTYWRRGMDILHEAFLLDDPFVIDKLGNSENEVNVIRNLLLQRLEKQTDEFNVVNSIWAKEKLKEILDILNNVVPAGIDENNGEWSLCYDKYAEPIRFYNISAGLKSFVLLKLMLEKGVLKEQDVLILDEPEIHLHPEWQIKYAEIIILLQKRFDLTIVVTTHSRDFFEALELFSKKHKINDKCSFYLSEVLEDGVKFTDVSEDTMQVYKHLVTPSRLLDKMKFELEEMNNE